jgi:anti-sigma factor RsiW
MNCNDAQVLLHAYVDAELDAPTTLQYEKHVRDCPACAKTLAEQKSLQTGLKADALYYNAPENLRARLRSSLRQHSGPRLGHFPWRGVAAAACIVLFIGLGFLLGGFTFAPSKHDRLAQEVTSAHIRSMLAEHKVDVLSSDRHTVKPWFNDRLDFSPPMRDLDGFRLIGGRLDYVDARPVAVLVYKRREHFLDIFLWPNPANEDMHLSRETRQGYQLIHWCKAGMNHWVVSDLDPAELNEVVQRLRDQ